MLRSLFSKAFRAQSSTADGVTLADDASAPAPNASTIITSEQVFPAESLNSRDSALRFIAERAVELGIATDADELMAAFLKREGEGTTGMMDGFAVPHAKTAAVTRAAVMVVKDREGIADWDTMDQLPVTVAIALLVPEGQAGTTHIRLLSRVAEALMDEDFRAQVKHEPDASAIAEIVSARL